MSSISVVIPTYNRAEYIAATLRSILRQSHAPREVIVVDDGSTDDTRAACEPFLGSIQYIAKRNEGVTIARNVGIRAASGDWIAFCDSDDLWHPDKLQVQLQATMGVGADWSISGFGMIDPDGQSLPLLDLGFEETFSVFPERRLTAEQHFARWLDLHRVVIDSKGYRVFAGDAFGMLFLGSLVLPSAALVSRRVFDRVGAFDETFKKSEDTEFFHRAAACCRAAIVMSQLIEYRVGHPSIMNTDATPHIDFAIRGLHKAATLRPSLSATEAQAYRDGLRQLQSRLAYSRLSVFDGPGARRAVMDGWRRNAYVSPRDVGVLAASMLPNSLLRGLHQLKRHLAAWRVE